MANSCLYNTDNNATRCVYRYYQNEPESGVMSKLRVISITLNDNYNRTIWRIDGDEEGNGGEWRQGQIGNSAPYSRQVTVTSVYD